MYRSFSSFLSHSLRWFSSPSFWTLIDLRKNSNVERKSQQKIYIIAKNRSFLFCVVVACVRPSLRDPALHRTEKIKKNTNEKKHLFSGSLSESQIPFIPYFEFGLTAYLTKPLSPSLLFPHLPHSLNDHLRYTSTAKRLASHKVLVFETRECVACRSHEEDDSAGDETGCAEDETAPLNDGKGEVDTGAHIVGAEAADKGVELLRSRADS